MIYFVIFIYLFLFTFYFFAEHPMVGFKYKKESHKRLVLDAMTVMTGGFFCIIITSIFSGRSRWVWHFFNDAWIFVGMRGWNFKATFWIFVMGMTITAIILILKRQYFK